MSREYFINIFFNAHDMQWKIIRSKFHSAQLQQQSHRNQGFIYITHIVLFTTKNIIPCSLLLMLLSMALLIYLIFKFLYLCNLFYWLLFTTSFVNQRITKKFSLKCGQTNIRLVL
ncbi:hypothetical protein C1645_776428 [Glomus cerebriforme]|uniref:Transmembrane protein n=1 Tax=Glomus cerebriforme TaxID=658196 RepID=A0A397SYG2_9GLOM|nr:hypothetical protein C1645_776428 [Glomus cerebriforme]